jgi:hypothetical protein
VKHVGGRVAVAEPEVAVRPQAQVGGPIRQTRTRPARHPSIRRGVLRVAERPYLLAFQRSLSHQTVLLVTVVQELIIAFFAVLHAVRSASEHGAPGTDKFTATIKHHHRIRVLAGRVHCMVHVDVPLGILTHAVGVTVLDLRRQFTPVVNPLVVCSPSPRMGDLTPDFFSPLTKNGAATAELAFRKLRRVQSVISNPLLLVITAICRLVTRCPHSRQCIASRLCPCTRSDLREQCPRSLRSRAPDRS